MAEIRTAHPYHAYEAIFAQPALIDQVLAQREAIDRAAQAVPPCASPARLPPRAHPGVRRDPLPAQARRDQGAPPAFRPHRLVRMNPCIAVSTNRNMMSTQKRT